MPTAQTKRSNKHFAMRGYEQVLVYCMDQCRNNFGSWLVNTPAGPLQGYFSISAIHI